MNEQEHNSLTSNTRHTKAIAYMGAFCVVACVLIGYLLVTGIGEERSTIRANEVRSQENATGITGLEFRMEVAEQNLVRAEKERSELKDEWLAAVRDLKEELRPISTYVIEQKAREREREREKDAK